jgi:Ser/Thr protein kinase RdoA (MazF antagonist)
VTFTPDSTRAIAETACRLFGLPPAVSLLRLGENALYRVTSAPVVVRIARTADYLDDVRKEVRVARWLAGLGFPAARLRDGSQPLDVGGHPVTFWTLIDGEPAGRADVAALGALLRRLHSAPSSPDLHLPASDMLARVPERIAAAPVPAADKDFLLTRCADLRAQLADLRFPHPPTAIHGDAHIKNVMVTGHEHVLIDFERFAWGRPEWDLAVTATEHAAAGWWTDAEYAEFVAAYGWDVTTWPGFPVLRAANEIKMTTWIMQNTTHSAEIAAEYETRMHTIRTGERIPWTPF